MHDRLELHYQLVDKLHFLPLSLPIDGHIQPGEYKPEVSPKVRDVAYFIGLGLSFVAFVGSGLAILLLENPLSATVAAGIGLVSSGYSIISNGLGVVYRPGVQSH